MELIIRPENVFFSSGDPDETIHYIIEESSDNDVTEWERHCVLRRKSNPKLYDKLVSMHDAHKARAR